uniref:G-patch domain-containing protein n=1 Tax=Quercus lobata TaxID=97700 RepID=A0A7N2L8S4_QUELO
MLKFGKGKRAREDDDEGDEAGGGFGGFERHTKGIGMKLLQKMGYKGGGLGKNAQGILSPIEPKLRPKNMGMGFNETEEENKKNKKGLLGSDCEGVERVKEKQRLWWWSSTTTTRTKKKKKEEVEEEDEEEEKGSSVVVQMVYDMRGPEVRLLTNLENLKNEVPMPELQYNVRLVVDSVEFEMERSDRDLRSEEATLERLKEEKERLVVVAERQRKQLYSMGEILSVLDQLEEEDDSKLDSLTVAEQFIELRSRFPEDFKLYNLSCIACSYALPLFIREFQGWDPLQNPFHAVGVSVINTWQARDPEPMLRFLDFWENLLPPSVLNYIFDNIVMPKLSSAVGCWEPLLETVPIHQVGNALWLDLMVDMMERFFFAKWLQVLYHWLNASPNFEEITRWHLGWKELLPKELLANASIRYQLSRGLKMMNQVVEGLEVVQPGLEENIGYFRVAEQRQFEAPQKAETQEAAMSFRMDDMSVKKVIEAHTQQHSLLFTPKPGRRHNGHQIYAFGNLSVIIDALNQKVYSQTEEGWSLVSLQDLVDKHHSSLS